MQGEGLTSAKRDIRYQAAIIQDDHVLMLKVWDYGDTGKTFWVIPGGGREPGESEAACVQREVREETHLKVEVGRLLLDESDIPGGTYARTKTYLCTIRHEIHHRDGHPGTEPEIGSEDWASILEIGWFDLRSARHWDPLALSDPITLARLQGLQAVLEYTRKA